MAVQLLDSSLPLQGGMPGFIPWLGNYDPASCTAQPKQNRADLSPLRAETKCIQKHSAMGVNPHLLWLCSVKLPANIELAY